LCQRVRTACDHEGTILGSRDFVVIARRWRQRGPVRRPSLWSAAGVVDDRELAEAMADLLREDGADIEARVVSAYDFQHKLPTSDRERILDELHDRTTVAIHSDLVLRSAAAARLASYQHRSGRDRRSGLERRSRLDWSPPGGERRTGVERRSGLDRRREKSTA
jgi:hypothetical protein